MTLDLGRALHRLTVRLDRAADALLRDRADISYARFLALYMVGSEGADTQRVLAERLSVSEPSVSRMVRVLSDRGWLEVTPDPADAHRRRLRLTQTGQELVQTLGAELEARFAELVAAAGVGYEGYRDQTLLLLNQTAA